GLDSQMPLIAPMPLSDMYRSALAPPRFRSLVVVGFAGLALLLSAVGLFGLLSYAVAGRRRELGVRTALGAQPRRIVALVVGQAALPLAIGIAAGLAAAWAVAGWLAHLLFGIGPLDPASLAAAALLMAFTGGLAAWLPARRALALDPADVLRCE
ncbi:MAG: FtsX-like permease family protein, partial [Terriglobales bacterium]